MTIRLESDGFMVFASALPSFHLAALCDELRPLDESTPHETLAGMRRVSDLLDHPALWGLKEDPMRHLHVNYGTNLDGWHQDDWCGARWPGPRYLLFAYPRGVQEDWGPTEILTRTGEPFRVIGPPGICLLMGHATFHRPSLNRANEWRPMLRFVLREDEQS